MPEEKREVWQRGPLEDISGLLQPVAHALLQAREELKELTDNFPEYLLWERPAGLASPAFHLQHLTGVLDRLFTYAQSKPLSEGQLRSLSIEGDQSQTPLTLKQLVELFNKQVDVSIYGLRGTDISTLCDARTMCRIVCSAACTYKPINVVGICLRPIVLASQRVDISVPLNS